ncbi:MAG: DNA translocase FtsK, partial [Planctomycetes bacterium]|nr:DNA translocase FtsK [Planctomycetota bacterium]
APAPRPEPKPQKPYVLPELDMLDTPPPPLNTDVSHLEKRASQLIKTLANFKIAGNVVSVQQGPRITQFEISIAAGIPVSKIRNLADNIAMDLKALSVRIIAPIPGRDTIGIEIPNVKSELVALRDIVASVNRDNRKQMLPLCLAKDVSGAAIVADLAKMPHLLIAGATGSGKSVCINSIIMSFLMCLSPDECKLIMVDPKVVELSRFHDIPHLMSPVITDMQKAVGVLEWACQEMDERYEQMSMVSVNNLAKFNALGEEEIKRRVASRYGEEGLEGFPTKMPCIVVIIDELADLMMVAKKEVEHHIARLAAKSRAVGIHLILATQRPSADVITGLIKANMPSRIAFQVASKLDSRIILDQSGADTLLGQGDMLYLPPGTGKVQRAQGVFVSDEELFKVVDFCKAQRAPEYHAALEGPVIGGGVSSFDPSKVDEMFFESGEAIIQEQRGSVSLLQRKLGLGYGRAARIIDQLADFGVLGPFKGSGKPREIVMELSEFYERFSAANKNARPQGGRVAGLRDDERERDGGYDEWE